MTIEHVRRKFLRAFEELLLHVAELVRVRTEVSRLRLRQLILGRSILIGLSWLSLCVGGCSTSAPSSSDGKSNPVPEPVAKPATASWSAWKEDDLKTDDFTPEEGFQAMTLSDFESFFAKPPKGDAVPTWSAVGNAIVCTGKPKGYLYSKEKFKDFTLRLEFRFAPPPEGTDMTKFDPNSGVMLSITEPHKQWPKSLEVQGKFSEMGKINPNGGVAAVELIDDAGARETARKPVGDWNGLEIVSKGGALTALLNGKKVCESQPGDVSEGAIGLQSEDFEVHFRRIRVRAEN